LRRGRPALLAAKKQSRTHQPPTLPNSHSLILLAPSPSSDYPLTASFTPVKELLWHGGTLRIYLVRHGDADADIPEGLSDEARALTAKARQQLWAHFESLKQRIQSADAVLTSPLVRTVQTAQILSLSLQHAGPLRAHRSLLPDMPVGVIASALAEHAGQNVILVGHQPSMGAVASHLLGLQTFPRPVSPGTVIGLERTESDGDTRFLFYAALGQPVLETLEK
jgi:phosphohistidine phosphatase